MSAEVATTEVLRVEVDAPVVSFRDPMFPGRSRCLPVPPPSTVAGMLGAAAGSMAAVDGVSVGMAFTAEGGGEDLETYQPINRDGSLAPVRGRVREGKGGPTAIPRPFLADAHLTLWLAAAEVASWEAALRRPVWGLRLGRSQDLAYVSVMGVETLSRADHARVGHALVPEGGALVPGAVSLRLAVTVSSDRRRSRFDSFLWCPEGAGLLAVAEAWATTAGEAVWLLDVSPLAD
jgi:CRISPR-associated endonuclease/helicase Cas3